MCSSDLPAKPSRGRRLLGIARELLLFAALALVAMGVFGRLRAPDLPPEAPAFTLLDLDGAQVSLADYAGRPVVLNFWATWCTPCRMETPYLQSVFEEYAEDGFEIVGVSMDTGDAADDVAMFAEEYAVTYTILHDPEMRGMELYQVLGLPATFLIDREGVLRWMRYGPIPEDDPEFLSALDDVIS